MHSFFPFLCPSPQAILNSIKCNTISPCGSSCLSVSEELAHCSWWLKVLLHLPCSTASFVWDGLPYMEYNFLLFTDQMWQGLLSRLAEFCTVIHFCSTELSYVQFILLPLLCHFLWSSLQYRQPFMQSASFFPPINFFSVCDAQNLCIYSLFSALCLEASSRLRSKAISYTLCLFPVAFQLLWVWQNLKVFANIYSILLSVLQPLLVSGATLIISCTF